MEIECGLWQNKEGQNRTGAYLAVMRTPLRDSEGQKIGGLCKYALFVLSLTLSDQDMACSEKQFWAHCPPGVRGRTTRGMPMKETRHLYCSQKKAIVAH